MGTCLTPKTHTVFLRGFNYCNSYSVLAPLVQALCVARSRATMGTGAELQQRRREQQQQQQQADQPVRISKRQLRLPGEVDPDLMESLLQVVTFDT